MTDPLELADETFDVVIDKAAIRWRVEGDVWNPSQICDQARSICQHVSRILVPGGHFFANIPWRKFILIDYCDRLACFLPRLDRDSQTTLVCYLQTNTIFANFTCRWYGIQN
jgi:hypothetical protein